jgi:Protein of unknown function (DUF3300)
MRSPFSQTSRDANMRPPSSAGFMTLFAVILITVLATSGAAAAQQPGPPPPPPQGYPQQGYPQQGYPDQAPPPPPPSNEPAYGEPQPPAPYLAPQQLDQLVQRIALYPDPLLAQILTAASVWEQIPDAAAWANQHAYLHDQELANAIQADNLQWDPSVMALLPFPQVLQTMASDPGWTQALGGAVLAQRNEVMDAVQRDRQEAYSYGYLRPNPYDNVVYDGNYIQIVPVNPAYMYVPYYDPAVVFVRPRPGFAVGYGIRFGPAIVVGGAFRPWGWGSVGFAWGAHNILIDHTPWNRVWVNRGYYAHSYEHGYVHGPGPRVEHHEDHHEEHRDEHHR